jgi:hypothetical protein
MSSYTVSEVFVPGGMPVYTYVKRTERKLEESVAAAKEHLCKLVTVTGMTKCGKTVLTSKVFPKTKSIWINGGTVGEENDFWASILVALEGYTDTGQEDTKERDYQIESMAEGQLGFFGVVTGKANTTTGHRRASGTKRSRSLSVSPRVAAINLLSATRKALVIDDFHYLDRDLQGEIVRALKPLIFEGVPIIFIAIPHRRFDAIKVEREITGRIQQVVVPVWDPGELLQIPREGFRLLNLQVTDEVCERLANEAYGSPHLMQEFCRGLAKIHDITETARTPYRIDTIPDSLFLSVAEETGKVIYDKLAKGPRQRKDRLQRHMKNGSSADIYGVTLKALSHIRPGLQTVQYETLRASLREILAEDLPGAHEVTRVLEKMAEIAASDESSTPVLDWDKNEQELHITDPFFAFYLKWGTGREYIVPE